MTEVKDGREWRDIDAMSADELKAEVWYWRTAAGDRIAAALRELKRVRAEGLIVGARHESSTLSSWCDLLDRALDGSGPDHCGLCEEPLLPGMAALREMEEGDVHAGCLGTLIGDGAGEGEPGDRFQLDPEGVIGDDDEPVEGGDGILVAHAYRPMRTPDEILDLVRQGWEAIA